MNKASYELSSVSDSEFVVCTTKSHSNEKVDCNFICYVAVTGSMIVIFHVIEIESQ